MRIPKRKTALFFFVFILLAVLCVPHSPSLHPIPGLSLLNVADFEATERFGDQSVPHFLRTFYDVDGSPAVHLFLVTKNQKSIPEDIEKSIAKGRDLLKRGQTLLRSGKTEKGKEALVRGRTLLLQEDRFGTLLISARNEDPSLVAFHNGLPTYLIARKEAEERVETFSNAKHAILLGVLYLSPFEYYLEFQVGGEKILASPFNSEIVFAADLEQSPDPPSAPFLEPSEDLSEVPQRNLFDSKEEDNTGAGLAAQFPDSLIIPGVPDYNQRSSIPNSCGPTAGATLLGYWDAQGYEDFVQGAGTYDDVTRLIEELCVAMGWDPTFGVYYSQIPSGLWQIMDDRRYEFDISSLYSISSLDIVRQEIVQGRPFVYGSQENPWGTPHYVVVVGYDGNFIITHDNWWSTPEDYYVNWDALGHADDMLTTLIPEGQVGPSSQALPSGLGGSGGGCFISTASKAK